MAVMIILISLCVHILLYLDLLLGISGVRILVKREVCLVSKTSRLVLEATQSSFEYVPSLFSEDQAAGL